MKNIKRMVVLLLAALAIAGGVCVYAQDEEPNVGSTAPVKGIINPLQDEEPNVG